VSGTLCNRSYVYQSLHHGIIPPYPPGSFLSTPYVCHSRNSRRALDMLRLRHDLPVRSYRGCLGLRITTQEMSPYREILLLPISTQHHDRSNSLHFTTAIVLEPQHCTERAHHVMHALWLRPFVRNLLSRILPLRRG
jgi:hypothetical protein